jgi:hypothetical protein
MHCVEQAPINNTMLKSSEAKQPYIDSSKSDTRVSPFYFDSSKSAGPTNLDSSKNSGPLDLVDNSISPCKLKKMDSSFIGPIKLEEEKP